MVLKYINSFMSFFLNREINEKSHLKSALTSIFGVGYFFSENYCRELGFNPNSKCSALTNKQKAALGNYILDNKKNTKQEDLNRNISEKILHLIDIRCYRGLRHKNSLPLRGQRTHTNGKTAKKLNRIRFRIK